ncbi:hypothetical protein G9A89_020644 [Geosiphon pyriformis]|nr:hypothetical protein G9A89_020644 [Geosiphon pyriformis]
MGDYSYLPQQSEEHFAAHNRNDLEFIELNLLPSCLICFSVEEQSSRQFQDFWNWFLNEHSAETYTAYTIYYFDQAYFEDNFEEKNTSINQLLYSTTFEQQPPNFEYLNHQIHIWIAAHQLVENSFETEEESYQTAPIFDIFSSKSEHSTQTVTPEPMAQDPMQANILAALQEVMHKIQLNAYFEDNFEEKNTSINQLLYSTTFEQQPPNFEYLNHQIHIWIAAHQLVENSFETEEESYQTAPIFDIFSSKSEHSTQTVTPEPMAQDPMQANILAALQGIQTALGGDAQDPIEWLDDFERAATANQYDDEYKFQIMPANAGENNISFTTWFENKFRTPILISKWHMELERRTQGPEDPLVEATGESASQPEENPFFTFNLTNDDHDMDELTINTSESTRKKKKAKIDFVLNPNKASTSTADNNEPPKAKVFKNPPKLESPEIVQKSGPYSVVKDLMKTPAHITFSQLMTHPQFRKDLHKSLIPKKKTPKTNKRSHQVELADNSNVTPLICKAQVAGYFIDLILDSGSSKKGLGIAKAIPVHINGISIETDMEVSEAKEYTIIVGNEWFKKAKALLDYELCELTIRCGEKPIVVKSTKQNQEDEQSEESDDEESDKEDEQEEQEETAELAYTIFTSNGKPLDNVKADREGIIVNGKLICWLYYDILRRTFDQKPGKKAKYSYCLIPRDELKEVQKSFENKPPEIQSLVVKQREPFPEERKIDIENLLARNSPVILKESDTPGRTHVIQHTITTRETHPIHLKPYQSNC